MDFVVTTVSIERWDFLRDTCNMNMVMLILMLSLHNTLQIVVDDVFCNCGFFQYLSNLVLN